jgi:hypothetical protein
MAALSFRNRAANPTPPEGYSVKEHDKLFSWCRLLSGPKQDTMWFSHYEDKTRRCAESRHFYSQWEQFFC